MISIFYFVIWCILVFLFACSVVASISQKLKMKIFKLEMEIEDQKQAIRELKFFMPLMPQDEWKKLWANQRQKELPKTVDQYIKEFKKEKKVL